jgi:peroxiredoxin
MSMPRFDLPRFDLPRLDSSRFLLTHRAWVRAGLAAGLTMGLAVVLAGCSSSKKAATTDTAKAATEAAKVAPDATQQDGAEPNNVGKPAPGFTLTDSTGKTIKLADYRGKVVLLNFWATWCGPCKIEMPWFTGYEQQYQGKDFAVLGVSLDEDGWKAVKPYLASHKIGYPVMIGGDDISQAYGGIDSLPTTFLIGKDGRIASMHVGLVSKSVYDNEIQKLLAAPKQSANLAQPAELLAFLRLHN